jgi:hypothetical protein
MGNLIKLFNNFLGNYRAKSESGMLLTCKCMKNNQGNIFFKISRNLLNAQMAGLEEYV